MFNYFYPDTYGSSLYDLPYGKFKSDGLVNILFDIDNTIAPVDATRPGVEAVFFFCKLKEMGFNACILSNGRERRVRAFAEALGAPYVAKAGKPFSKGLGRALAILNAERRDTVIIGDQLFTDVLCGKRHGIHAALVRPISDTEEWYVKLKRVFERPVLAEYKSKRGYAR